MNTEITDRVLEQLQQQGFRLLKGKDNIIANKAGFCVNITLPHITAVELQKINNLLEKLRCP